MSRFCYRRCRKALAVPAVFVIVVSGALIYVALQILSGAPGRPAAGRPVPPSGQILAAAEATAPSAEDYRRDFRAAVRPLLSGELPETEALQAVRDGIFSMTVPAAARESHLEMVLVLDSLIQAEGEGARLAGKAGLESWLSDNPWVDGSEPVTAE